jgi:hypothetical protein
LLLWLWNCWFSSDVELLVWYVCGFVLVGLAYQGKKDIVCRFIIEYIVVA